MEAYKVSIATGCYNSATFIERTFKSIVAQNYRNLEWNVVVDGLTDATLSLVRSFQEQADFPINIIVFEENRGGTISVLTAVQACRGDFTIILDHDDELLPNALHGLLGIWDEVVSDRSSQAAPLAAIYGRCVNERSEFLGQRVDPLIVGTLGHFQHVIKCRAECGSLVRTDVLLKFYHFSESEIGATNGLIWNRIDKSYASIFTDLVVRRYHTNIASSLSNQKKIRAPAALSNQELESLNNGREYLLVDPLVFLRKITMYLRYGAHAQRNFSAMISELEDPRMRMAAVCVLPVALWAARRDRRLERLA